MDQILPLLSPSHAVPFIYAFLQLRGNSIFSRLEDSLFCVAVPLGSGLAKKNKKLHEEGTMFIAHYRAQL